MSRIGKKPIAIPPQVTVESKDGRVLVSGPKGKLEFRLPDDLVLSVGKDTAAIECRRNLKRTPALWGTAARLVANMIEGVTAGFQKSLELNGVGYRMNVQGKKLALALGFSHPVELIVPEEISVAVENNILTVSGIDKQRVGQFAASIRSLKPVEPYKGKGFRYVGETVRRKEGKKAGTTA